MNSYKNIPLWEHARRCRVLAEFRNDVISYFNNSSAQGIGASRTEKIEAVQARQRINRTVLQAQRIIEAAGISSTITWTAPAVVGGYVRQVDLISNLFELDGFHVPANTAVDLIERALGFYQDDRTAAKIRTFNLLWWLFRGLLWLARIPFIFLGAMGFDAARAEGSALGKFFKAIFSLLFASSALLTILNLMGWLPAVKSLLDIE